MTPVKTLTDIRESTFECNFFLIPETSRQLAFSISATLPGHGAPDIVKFSTAYKQILSEKLSFMMSEKLFFVSLKFEKS